MLKPDDAGSRIGPFWFAPGWSRRSAATVWLASFLTIGLTAYMAFVQPYLLNEVLHVPRDRQGTITGELGALQEIIVIVLVSFIGAWSDRAGRRRVYYLGFLALAAGYAVYPLATSVGQLILYRCVFAVGVAMAPLMLSACVVDAIQEVSRGRWIGTNNLLQGLGVTAMSVGLSKLPLWYEGMGAAPLIASRYAYWSAAGLCLVAAAIVAAGLPRVTANQAGTSAKRTLAAIVGAFGHARGNPKLAVAYAAAFIGRGDFVVVGVFSSLWIVQAGHDAGMTSGVAMAKAGTLLAALHLSALLWAIVMGIIADRMNRLTALCLAQAAAGLGYIAMGQVADPFSARFIPVAILLGIGEISVIVTGGALLGQEVPAENRGPVIGLYNAIGGVGILFATYVGGLVFDWFGPTAPFTMVGMLNVALMVAALWVRARTAVPAPGTAAVPEAAD